MIRRIIAEQHQAAQLGTGKEVDGPVDRVVKYIPTEIVSAWVAAKGVVEGAATQSKLSLLWVCFALGVILTIGFILKQTATPGQPLAIKQTAISTVAFIIWVIALGEPFANLFGQANQPLYGALLLIGYTVVMALVKDPDPPVAR